MQRGCGKFRTVPYHLCSMVDSPEARASASILTLSHRLNVPILIERVPKFVSEKKRKPDQCSWYQIRGYSACVRDEINNSSTRRFAKVTGRATIKAKMKMVELGTKLCHRPISGSVGVAVLQPHPGRRDRSQDFWFISLFPFPYTSNASNPLISPTFPNYD